MRGRLVSASPAQDERYYLCILLSNVTALHDGMIFTSVTEGFKNHLAQGSRKLRTDPGQYDSSVHLEANTQFGVFYELQEEYAIVTRDEHIRFRNCLNHDQQVAYDEIISHVDNDYLGVFYIDGPGRSGKTYLYNALLAEIRSLGLIAIATTTFGAAANNMSGGRTALRFILTLSRTTVLRNKVELPNY
ncbi:ATP-dependent DNA helicase PIF1-like protein [Tanacetum coccineum]